MEHDNSSHGEWQYPGEHTEQNPSQHKRQKKSPWLLIFMCLLLAVFFGILIIF